MKYFDFKRYATENRLTLASKLASRQKKQLREAEEDDTWDAGESEFDSGEFEKEPSKKDMKKSAGSMKGAYKKREMLADLTRKKDALVNQLKQGVITIDQYKDAIGTIPQQIKTLTADLAQLTGLGGDDEDADIMGGEVEESAGGPIPGPYDFFEKYDNTDLNGSGMEMAMDDLINEVRHLIQTQIPEEDRSKARIAIKVLWRDQLARWKS